MNSQNRRASHSCRLSLVGGVKVDSERRNGRKAFILICTLVCLSVSTAIVIMTTHESLQFRRQGRKDRQLRQTQWLLDAGIRKAIGMLNSDTSYMGESWRPKSALASYSHVLVDIEITSIDGDANRRLVRVTAQLGNAGVQSEMDRQAEPLSVDRETSSVAWYEKTQCSHQFEHAIRPADAIGRIADATEEVDESKEEIDTGPK